MQHNLFPTIGLQTPGEVIEANFGNESFIYDIDDYILVSITHFTTHYFTPHILGISTHYTYIEHSFNYHLFQLSL